MAAAPVDTASGRSEFRGDHNERHSYLGTLYLTLIAASACLAICVLQPARISYYCTLAENVQQNIRSSEY